MIGNPVHFTVAHIATDKNVVADKISRIQSESHLPAAMALLKQEHPDLAGCQRYQLTSSQLSLLMEVLSQAECTDPIAASRLLLTAREKTIISNGVTTTP